MVFFWLIEGLSVGFCCCVVFEKFVVVFFFIKNGNKMGGLSIIWFKECFLVG